MTPKDYSAAGNAMVQWFNSQDIAPTDAHVIMVKVIASIITRQVGARGPDTTAQQRRTLDETIDAHMLALVHAVNDQLFAKRKG